MRHLEPIEARLDSYGVLDLVGNSLIDQQADLLWLLAKPPQQVLKEIGAIQRQKMEDLEKYRGQRKQEEIARLTASFGDQDGNDND
ncbi:MAG: hypothetical protein ACFFGZ_03285 [Candidatus Thorarchaeota archaeon]